MMSHEVGALLRVEVQRFLLTADILHMCFQLHIPTLPRNPYSVELQMRYARITEVQAVTLQSHDPGRWICLLAFWICVLLVPVTAVLPLALYTSASRSSISSKHGMNPHAFSVCSPM